MSWLEWLASALAVIVFITTVLGQWVIWRLNRVVDAYEEAERFHRNVASLTLVLNEFTTEMAALGYDREETRDIARLVAQTGVSEAELREMLTKMARGEA